MLFNQPPQSICILRLSAIGDVCHALAAVQRIQQHWKNTKITWIVGKTEAQLLQGIPNLNLVIFDKKAGWQGIWQLWQQLKHQPFDALLNMQTALRASLLSLGIQATYKIGFNRERAREGQWLITNRKINPPSSPHVLDGFMAFVDYLGVPFSPPSWNLFISKKEQASVKSYIDPTRKNVIISPCSSKEEKDWSINGYVAVIHYLQQQNINVILCGSSATREVKVINAIMQHCDNKPINLAGKTSLRQLAALIGMADLVLSPDSAAAHLATVQNTPVIGLYAYHNPLRTGPYNALDQVISVYEQNAVKEFGKPSSQLPWATKLKGKNLMDQIQVDTVINKVRSIL